MKAGYGPTIRADAVKKLVDSVVNFQEKSRTIINEMREQATKNSAEIRDAVEDGKRRLAAARRRGQRADARKQAGLRTCRNFEHGDGDRPKRPRSTR